jgi:hypothetical protein
MSSASIVVVVSGLVAFACSAAIIMPASRGVIASLRALHAAAERKDLERFVRSIEPLSPITSRGFVHKRITGMLRADFAPFGEECLRLQAEAKRFDRRAHYGLIPLAIFALGCLIWYGASP